MKKLVSIILTAAMCAAMVMPVAAEEKITADEVKELIWSTGLQNYPELWERDVIIENPWVNGWEKDTYKLKDLADVTFSYRGYGMRSVYCEGRSVDWDDDYQMDFAVLDKNGRMARVAVFSEDYEIEKYRGKIYFDDLSPEKTAPYSDESFSFFSVNGEKYGYEKIAELINEADIGKVDKIVFVGNVLYIHSEKGEYVIPCERSSDVSAAYLGREEIRYEKGVLIPFEEFERIEVYIDKNDRDDHRPVKYVESPDIKTIENTYDGDEVRETDTRAAYIGTESKFTDVRRDLVSYVNELSDLGIINGYGDGTFDPDGTLTRAEATALIARMMKYSGEYDGSFSDVPRDAWYAPELAALVERGIINGVGDNKFMPDNTIRYVDFLKIVEGILGYRISSSDPETDVIDYDMNIGLTNGIGSFSTYDAVTRGAAAIILSNALDSHMSTYVEEVSGPNVSIGTIKEDITLIDYINGGKLNGALNADR